tara:strand:- start:1037 stop:2401 length:1365 start_codon:yes stop_codon:yes gene_type:complete
MATILGANTLSGGYEVANSCRFNRADGPNMTKTPGSSGDLRKWTWSCWVKRGSISNGSQTMFNAGSSSNTQLRFDSDDSINFYQYHSGAYTARLATNRKFKDVTAWYHIVAHWDTDNGTGGDRMKLFVNGVEETSFATDTNPSQNLDSYFGASGTAMYVGDKGDGAEEMDGYLSEMVFIDGQNLAPTSFGEFDEDTPRTWKPIDVSGLTFGTNGFYLDFEDSSNLGNDASGGTDFTENNIAAVDQATDTCTNNFCTLNPLVRTDQITFSEGNCKFSNHGSNDDTGGGIGTFGVTKGKWYFEIKLLAQSGNHTHGVISEFTNPVQQALQNKTGVTSWRNSDGGEVSVDGTVGDEDYGIMAQDSIMGIALDMDNYNISFYDDNTALASNINMSSTRGTIFPCITAGLGTTAEVNFGGCSAFAVSSAESDANGYGNFEHAPPSNYYALCTKNLAEYG